MWLDSHTDPTHTENTWRLSDLSSDAPEVNFSNSQEELAQIYRNMKNPQIPITSDDEGEGLDGGTIAGIAGGVLSPIVLMMLVMYDYNLN
jgi:hypothetical protein